MYTNKKRILLIILISVIMNFLLFLASYFLRLPLWLDTTGTIYSAILLGFPVGFIVAIINNVTQALFFYGTESLNFYFVSALTAFVTGLIMKKNQRNSTARWITLACALLVVSIAIAVPLTFVTTAGIPNDYWGQTLYLALQESGFSPAPATVFSVSLVKALDVVTSVILVRLAYTLTPGAIRENKTAII